MKFTKSYTPAETEATIYQLWEGSGVFTPSKQGTPYSVVMPPPNANGNLHIGHGFEMSLKDILVRHERMKGKDAVYIPGADHAGFETWVVYEKALEKAGKSRFDFTRDQLYQQVWDFVVANRGNMELQIRALGIGCSWPDLVFTLDPKVVKTVYDTFEKMWNDGLIYRGERIVNYCTKHQTSFADIEVDYQDEETPLYYIKYGPFILATTRPETKFGDTAVAVHPSDKRYQKYIGQEIEVKGVNGAFKVKVVADEMVDPEFGTGVVKVTPAHSFDDFEVAQRHHLPAVRVIDKNGKMTEKAGRFAGMTVLEARKAVVEAMEEQGLIDHVDKHYKTRIGHCYKCGTVIEPMLMPQWFVKVKPLVDRAVKAVKNGEIKFYPENKGKVLLNYYKKLKDWNISRQIPWGIPIPMFRRVDGSDDETESAAPPKEPVEPEWIFDTRVDQKEIEVNGRLYVRDEDTLDTWFSSGQWPYIVTDHLEKGDLARFYPNNVMENGLDLLFPWDSRMIMLGLYRTGQVPFKELYLHGMVLDEHGQKMSKSKGNVINPMEVIAEYGADAFRLGIVSARSAGQSQAFSLQRVVAGRNLCNKLWNIARFIQSKADEFGSASAAPTSFGGNSRRTARGLATSPVTTGARSVPTNDGGRKELSPGDSAGDIIASWIRTELTDATAKVDQLLSEYRFSEAVETVHSAIWNTVADWFIEAEKTDNNVNLMKQVLEQTLKLVHPFAPFVSETIWQNLSWTSGILAAQKYALGDIKSATASEMRSAHAKFTEIQNLITEVRRITSDLPKGKYALAVKDSKLVKQQTELIESLAKLSSVKEANDTTESNLEGLPLTGWSGEAWLEISSEELRNYKTRLQERIESTSSEVKLFESRLANQNYLKKAPTELVQETQAQLGAKKVALERLQNEFSHL